MPVNTLDAWPETRLCGLLTTAEVRELTKIAELGPPTYERNEGEAVCLWGDKPEGVVESGFAVLRVECHGPTSIDDFVPPRGTANKLCYCTYIILG